MEFTVIGDTVNVAARIQALAHGSQVLTTVDSLGEARSQMSLLLYPDTPIRGRLAGVTIACVRSIMKSPAAHGSMQLAADEMAEGSGDEATHPPGPLSGQHILASIPVEIPELGGRAILIAANLGVRPELELLADHTGALDQTYHVVPAIPELDASDQPGEAICLSTVAEGHCHLIRLRLTQPAPNLLALLSPGVERRARRPLRKKR